MIDTIIFDFGDIFIDLDKAACSREFAAIGLTEMDGEIEELNHRFEVGEIDELAFLEGFQKKIPHADILEIRKAWNALIGDFPLHRLEFLQMLSGKYRLFLLTNTDSIHIDRFEHKVGMTFARDFYQCFEKVYYSYEMGMRKPDPKLFETIMSRHGLDPEKTLFVDDKKENTDSAAALGLRTWNLQPGQEDVSELFNKKFL